MERPRSRAASFESNEYDSDRDTIGLLDDEKAGTNTEPGRPSPRRQQKRNWVFLAVNTFILLTNVGLLLMMSTPRTVSKSANTPRLPHQDWIGDAYELQVTKMDDKFGAHGPFRGRPRPELDEAWAGYVRNYTVRVPKPGWTNATSNGVLAEFQDREGGIMATFAFLHNLHCLKTIRQWMLPEFYPETRAMYPPSEEEPIPEHIDHCIDMLRQSELCHADMALNIFEWQKESPTPINIHGSPHVCANMDKVNRFLEEHTVPPFGSVLKHPWTGKEPFPYT